MAQIQGKCQRCGAWENAKARTCTQCGFAMGKRPGREYRVDYRDSDGRRTREKIGPSLAAAEQRLREVLTGIAEGRHIHKSKDATIKFEDLAKWYMSLPEVQAKRSYNRDELSVKRLLAFFGDKALKDITPALVEAYRQERLKEPSGRSPKNLTRPATVNREIACLKTIFNKGIGSDKCERYPFKGVKALRENNERDRVLSSEEYARLLAHCPTHLKEIIKVAYYTAMRQGEILNLTWGQVDLREGFIKLRPEDTKTSEGREVPLCQELIDMLKAMRPAFPLPHVRVFTYAGRSVGSIKRAFATACKRAGIEDFTFHDLRHTAINNWRLQGHDYFRIMAASGHKTMHVFKRYNTVSRDELRALALPQVGK